MKTELSTYQKYEMTLNRFHQYFNFLKEKYPELKYNGSPEFLTKEEREKWNELELAYQSALNDLKNKNENGKKEKEAV